MDPDKTWAELVKLAFACRSENCDIKAAEMGDDMAERIIALNDWVGNGGFPPAPFRKPASED